jgi:hypothetical protein
MCSKYNMFYLYFGLCIISAVVIYWYIPETRHVPVEELGALFGDAVVVHLTPDGHGILEDKGPVVETMEDLPLERKPGA